MNRRELLRWASLSGLGWVGLSCATNRSILSASKDVRLALVGCGYQGQILLNQALTATQSRIMYVCDPDSQRMESAAQLCTRFKQSPKKMGHFHDLLAKADIDAFIIATPNFWHTAMAAAALKSGRDVFLEKPISHTLDETLILKSAYQTSGRALQVGTNLRSNPNIQAGIAHCHARPVKDIKSMRIRVHKSEAPVHFKPLLGEMDWKEWSGRAPLFPKLGFMPHYIWHFYWSYGGGHFLNYGVHLLDLAFWILESELTNHATSLDIQTMGNRLFVQDDAETPNILFSNVKIGKIPITIEVITSPLLPKSLYKQRTLTVEYSDQKVIFDLDGKCTVIREGVRQTSPWLPDMHFKNFVQHLSGLAPLTCPLEKSLFSTQLAHAINNCYFRSLAQGKPIYKFYEEYGVKANLFPKEATFFENRISLKMSDLTEEHV